MSLFNNVCNISFFLHPPVLLLINFLISASLSNGVLSVSYLLHPSVLLLEVCSLIVSDLKLKKWEPALLDCNLVLSMDAKNIKGWLMQEIKTGQGIEGGRVNLVG